MRKERNNKKKNAHTRVQGHTYVKKRGIEGSENCFTGLSVKGMQMLVIFAEEVA